MLLAAIVHQDQFRIRNSAVQREDAAFKKFYLIPEGDDDADMAMRQRKLTLRFE